VRLAASFLVPNVPEPWPCVLFVHGLGSSKDSPRNVVIAEGLRDHGIATLLFDLNGHGDSTTDPNGVNEGFVADVAAAWSWATSNPALAANRIGISGSSIGGVVALHAAREGLVHPAVFVLRAPPIDASDVHGLAFPTTVVVGSEDHLKYGISSAAAACPRMMVSVVDGASHLFEEPGTLEEASRLTIEAFEAALGPASVPR
jgi:putative phosphoribosyl transferase